MKPAVEGSKSSYVISWVPSSEGIPETVHSPSTDVPLSLAAPLQTVPLHSLIFHNIPLAEPIQGPHAAIHPSRLILCCLPNAITVACHPLGSISSVTSLFVAVGVSATQEANRQPARQPYTPESIRRGSDAGLSAPHNRRASHHICLLSPQAEVLHTLHTAVS